jgi:hypothetical protein
MAENKSSRGTNIVGTVYFATRVTMPRTSPFRESSIFFHFRQNLLSATGQRDCSQGACITALFRLAYESVPKQNFVTTVAENKLKGFRHRVQVKHLNLVQCTVVIYSDLNCTIACARCTGAPPLPVPRMQFTFRVYV